MVRHIGLLAWAVVSLASCAGLSLAERERETREQFELDARDLSASTVSLHDRVRYLSPSLENSCGITCLDMILELEGRALPPEDARLLLRRLEERGEVSNGQLVEALQSAGLLGIHLQGELAWPPGPGEAAPGSWENPFRHIEDGRPVILRILLPSDRFHYVLLVGYDPESRKVVLVNPGYGLQVWPERSLVTWKAADRWFVAYKQPSTEAG